ncbi:hypothetical protein BD769DRAFT_1674640 [Suillus cothurnatus]|nr:hypothetical protein BD769DRAFT_1674640 [Suillus cothurnatus]
MSHQDQNYDIFAISTPTPEDERTIRLRKEVNNLSDRLSDLLRTAPATNSNTNFLETEDWCRKWTAVTSSLRAHLTIVRAEKLNISLTETHKQHGATGDRLCAVLQGQIKAVKDVAAKQVDPIIKGRGPSKHGKDIGETVEEPEGEEEQDSLENVIACDRCVGARAKCYSIANCAACRECKQHKTKCSLVEQSKAKQNSPPPRKQAVVENSKPAATGTIVVRSRNWRRPGPASKVAGISSSVSGTKNKAVQRPRSAAKTPRSATQPLMDHTDIAEADHSRKRKRKVVVQDEDESSNSDDGSSAAEPRRKRKRKVVLQDEDESRKSDDGSGTAEPRRLAMPPFTGQPGNADIGNSRKRKHKVVVQDESRKSDDGNDEEDNDETSYLAGRVSGLHKFIVFMEAACATMSREVEEIHKRASEGQHTRR